MPAEAEEDLLDEYDDDDNDEGIFDDEEDIFDSEGKVDHDNAVITREQEQAQVYDIKGGKEKPGGGKEKKRRKLIARFDARERPFVAVFEEGKGQTTKWRPPTKAEAKKLDEKGRIVKGGIVNDDAEDDETDDVDLGEAEEKKMPTWLKVGLGVLAVAGVAGGGYMIYKSAKSDDDAEVDEVDD